MPDYKFSVRLRPLAKKKLFLLAESIGTTPSAFMQQLLDSVLSDIGDQPIQGVLTERWSVLIMRSVPFQIRVNRKQRELDEDE